MTSIRSTLIKLLSVDDTAIAISKSAYLFIHAEAQPDCYNSRNDHVHTERNFLSIVTFIWAYKIGKMWLKMRKKCGFRLEK